MNCWYKSTSPSPKRRTEYIKRKLKLRVRCKVQIFNGFRFPHLLAGLAAAVMAPSRRAKNILPFFLPADIPPREVLADGPPFMEDETGRAGLFHRLGQPVSGGLVFFRCQLGLEGSEQLVPDDQEHPHILIQVTRIGSVVHPVVGGGDQDIFQPAHLADEL